MTPEPVKGKSPEQAFKEHTRELYNRGVSDVRRALLARPNPVPISDVDYKVMLQSVADRSMDAAKIFRSTWIRRKAELFPKDDK